MMKRSALIRLGLFQLGAGGMSVLFLGVLNRILRVEMGLDLLVVSVLVGGGHYLGALAAIPFGYYSDRHPLLGYRRSLYILLGVITTTLILALSPWMATWLSSSLSPFKYLVGFAFFLLEGIATFISGTAFLALITDRTTRDERGRATGLVWTMLFLGIILTGVMSGVVLEGYSYPRFAGLFVIYAVFVLLVSVLALFNQEERGRVRPHSSSKEKFTDALEMLLHDKNARRFGIFLWLSMSSYFMQDVILEPYGGEILGLDPAATARFSAYMGVGLIASMLLGGMVLIPRFGKRWVTGFGCVILSATFIGLTVSALLRYPSGIELLLVGLGLGGGLFTVGGVAMMMDMTASQHTGLFVGAWTLVSALARGPASLLGGAIYDLLVSWGALPSQGYGAIFTLEAVGVAVSLVFLRRVAVDEFQKEAIPMESLVTEAMD